MNRLIGQLNTQDMTGRLGAASAGPSLACRMRQYRLGNRLFADLGWLMRNILTWISTQASTYK